MVAFFLISVKKREQVVKFILSKGVFSAGDLCV